jgi:hypothetical protein
MKTVIAGLDPAIHATTRAGGTMDARVSLDKLGMRARA